MAPKGRKAVIQALGRRLLDENSGSEKSDRSNDEMNVPVDPETNVPQMRDRTILIPMVVESTASMMRRVQKREERMVSSLTPGLRRTQQPPIPWSSPLSQLRICIITDGGSRELKRSTTRD